ncbi:THAP domain protein, partial [Necator americanus]
MTEPISVISQIVDDACTENDEDGYEEMEEEDEEIPLLDDTQSVLTYEEVESAGTRKSLPLTTPHCIVCCRTPTPKVRLFKWPEDRNLRKSWLAFFHLGLDHLDGCKASYICNIHFDANQFLYEGDRVYWRRDSFPRFRQRRSILAEPFPWEVTFNADKRLNHVGSDEKCNMSTKWRFENLSSKASQSLLTQSLLFLYPEIRTSFTNFPTQGHHQWTRVNSILASVAGKRRLT